MAKVKDVMNEYHKKVPFPLTVEKIHEAKYNPQSYLRMLASDLFLCSDYQDPIGQQIMAFVADLEAVCKIPLTS